MVSFSLFRLHFPAKDDRVSITQIKTVIKRLYVFKPIVGETPKENVLCTCYNMNRNFFLQKVTATSKESVTKSCFCFRHVLLCTDPKLKPLYHFPALIGALRSINLFFIKFKLCLELESMLMSHIRHDYTVGSSCISSIKSEVVFE